MRQPREEAGQTLVGLVFFLFPRSNFNLVGSCRIFVRDVHEPLERNWASL